MGTFRILCIVLKTSVPLFSVFLPGPQDSYCPHLLIPLALKLSGSSFGFDELCKVECPV